MRLICLLFSFITISLSAWCQDSTSVAIHEVNVEVGQRSCKIDAPDGASEIEKLVWTDLCTTGRSNVGDHGFRLCASDAPYENDPSDWKIPPEWRDKLINQYLSPQFIVTILTNPNYIAARPKNGLTLTCAAIELLDLREHEILGSIRIEDSIIGKINFRNARVDGTVSFNHSVVLDSMNAFGLETRRGFLALGARFRNGLSLEDAKIGGYLDLDKSHVIGRVQAFGVNVANSLYLRDAIFDYVQLESAYIDRNLLAQGAIFKGVFSADAIKVGKSVFLRDGATFNNRITLVSADVGKHLQLQGSRFEGKVDLSEASLGSLLLWRSSSRNGEVPAQDANWGESASLVLRNTQAESFQARMAAPGDKDDSWHRQDDSRSRLPVDLTGFSYAQLGGFGSGNEYDPAQIDAEALINWIDTSRLSEMEGYQPQPYRTMAKTLRNMGADAAAKEVAYARLIHRADTRISANWWTDFRKWIGQIMTFVFDKILQFTVGFGVYPQWAFYWFLLIVGIGTILARPCPPLCREGAPRATWWDSFFYSLENAIPLMEPSADYTGVRHDQLWKRIFFNAQKVFGFILASVLIGAMTLRS